MFYIFHGEDTHSQKETLAELKGKLGDASLLELNTTQFASDVTVSQLRQVCDSIPFLAKRRLVICQDVLAGAGADFVEALVAYLPDLPESTRLFFLEGKQLRTNHRVLKLAQRSEHGYVREFSRPEGGALNRWVQRRVEAKGGEITPRAVHELVTSIGNDLAVLDNEIEKLTLYAARPGASPGNGAQRPIDEQDVALLCPYVAEAKIFDLVDALGSRDGKQAALLLQRKLEEGADPFYLFAMIVRQFRLLIQVKEMAETGVAPAAIAKETGMHTFVAGKLSQQCRHFSLEQLEQVYAHLLETDAAVKTGQADMVTALHLLVGALT